MVTRYYSPAFRLESYCLREEFGPSYATALYWAKEQFSQHFFLQGIWLGSMFAVHDSIRIFFAFPAWSRAGMEWSVDYSPVFFNLLFWEYPWNNLQLIAA